MVDADDDSEVLAETVTILSGTVRMSGWLLLELLSFPKTKNNKMIVQKRTVFDDNQGIIFLTSPTKYMFWVCITFCLI